MGTVTAFEAKTRFGELLERVGRGEEVVITRHDKPVARIVPEGRQGLHTVQQAVLGLGQLRQQIALGSKARAKLSDAEVLSAIEAGRR